MKAMAKIFLLLFVALAVCGFAYHYIAGDSTHYEVVRYHEVVRKGDTFFDIASHYYNAENEKECFDEWLTIQKNRNSRLFHRVDGSVRALQVGDIVCIEVREKVVN